MSARQQCTSQGQVQMMCKRQYLHLAILALRFKPGTTLNQSRSSSSSFAYVLMKREQTERYDHAQLGCWLVSLPSNEDTPDVQCVYKHPGGLLRPKRLPNTHRSMSVSAAACSLSATKRALALHHAQISKTSAMRQLTGLLVLPSPSMLLQVPSHMTKTPFSRVGRLLVAEPKCKQCFEDFCQCSDSLAGELGQEEGCIQSIVAASQQCCTRIVRCHTLTMASPLHHS